MRAPRFITSAKGIQNFRSSDILRRKHPWFFGSCVYHLEEEFLTFPVEHGLYFSKNPKKIAISWFYSHESSDELSPKVLAFAQ